MEFLKVLFENGAVTWDQFAKGVKDKGLKIADLSEGNYVSKQKYDNDVHTKDTQIETLNKNIKTRDDDLEDLKNQLEAAGNDKEKLKELTGKFNTLQTDYNTAKITRVSCKNRDMSLPLKNLRILKHLQVRLPSVNLFVV